MTASNLRRAPLVTPLLLSLTLLVGVTHQAGANIGEGADAADRQQLVYEINLARWNPPAYGAAAGLVWNGVMARPPLALNDQLLESAQIKADEMAIHDYFAHRSEATGLWPNELARSAGYPLADDFKVEGNNIESLHSGSPAAFDVLGSFAKSPTHRVHLFGQSWFGNHREIGVGRSAIENFWAVHTAFRSDARPLLTGVVFADTNSNGRMDLGEGLTGVTVRVGDRTAVTNAGGGYSLQVEAGDHALTAFGGAFAGVASGEARVDQHNVGVDFISGDPEPVVRAYELCQGFEPSILGTSGDDVLVGTPGRDVIHGLGGRDLIDGRGGDDIICRGEDSLEVSVGQIFKSILRLDWSALLV